MIQLRLYVTVKFSGGTPFQKPSFSNKSETNSCDFNHNEDFRNP